MRLGTFRRDDSEEPWAGIVVDEESVIEVPIAAREAGLALARQLDGILTDWGWERKLALVEEYGAETGVGVRARENLDVLAPVQSPGKVVCVGLNYADHAAEGGRDVPETPVLFAKFPSAVIGPSQEIEWNPEATEQVDYEAELVVVIGKRATAVDPEEAWEHIAGYTVGNDVSARDLQHGDGQWVRGKSLDTFAPSGPALVTRDEIPDPHNLEIWAEVNGERLQHSSTDQLVFGVDELVSFCSQTSTLYPGDLLFTGTPPGVGIYREPPVLLDAGDEVSVGVEGLGVLTNECSHRS